MSIVGYVQPGSPIKRSVHFGSQIRCVNSVLIGVVAALESFPTHLVRILGRIRLTHHQADLLKINLFVLNILLPASGILASFDIQDTCPHLAKISCPFVTLDTGETIQHAPKVLTSNVDWAVANIPADIKMPQNVKRYYCDKPACLSNPCLHDGTCEESETGFLCICSSSYHGDRCENSTLRDCYEIQANGSNTSGVYIINPSGNGDPFSVYCDMETDGGGWTVFQRRQDGSVEFFLYWSDYKSGFGNVSAEHWLGNDNIHRLSTQKTNELRVDLEDFEGQSRYATYSNFRVANETANYMTMASGYSGNAGDSLLQRSYNLPFTTRDRENDRLTNGNCAVVYTGAWWYNACHTSNLNGQYLRGTITDMGRGVTWATWRGQYYSLKKTEMKIRPV